MAHHGKVRGGLWALLVACGIAAAAGTSAFLGIARADSNSPLYVDVRSKGGRCSDGYAASQVSITRPLCTIAKALAVAPEGATVLVRAGSYPKLTVTRPFGERLTVRVFPGESAELKGAHFAPTAQHVRLEQFRMTDITEVYGMYVEIAGNDMSPHGVVLQGGDNLIEGNYVHDVRIVFDGASSAPRCHNFWKLEQQNDQDGDGRYDYPLSETGGIAPRCGHAFRVGGPNQTIRDNTVRKVPADGVQAFRTTNLRVERNRFEDVAIQSSTDGGDPLEHPDGAQILGENRDTVFAGNVYIDTRGILPMMGGDGKWPVNVRVENNVFNTATKTSGSGDGCLHASAVTGLIFVNNTCWGSGGNFEPRVRISHDTSNPAIASETTGVQIKNNIIERLMIEPNVHVEEDYNLVKRYDELAPGYALGSHDIRDRLPDFVAEDLFLRLARGSVGTDGGTADGGMDRDRECRPRFDEPNVENTGGGSVPYFDIGANEVGALDDACPLPDLGYYGAVMADGPVSFWRLGELSGKVGSDQLGANRGSYLGGLTLGQLGAVAGNSAVKLNGSTGRLTVPNSASLRTGDNFTIEMWVKLGKLGVSHGLASKGFVLYIDRKGFVKLHKSGSGDIATSKVPIADTNEAHHVAVTKAGSTTKIYVDGVDRTGVVVNRTLSDNTSAMILGVGAGYLNGTLDEVALYRRALTASEVSRHYAAR